MREYNVLTMKSAYHGGCRQDFTVVFGIAPVSDDITDEQLGEIPLVAFNLLQLYPTVRSLGAKQV